jgi:hypothetical protein
MPIKHCTHLITRKELKDNPNVIYVFGDNMIRQGYGGQAKEMRGEPNAVGIPTKYSPSLAPHAFFTNKSLEEKAVKDAIDEAFARLEERLLHKQIVVIPAGIGTGLADLPKRAPLVHLYIMNKIQELETKYGCYKV